MISGHVEGVEQVVHRFEAFTPQVHDRLVRVIRGIGLDLKGYIQQSKLQGQVLRHRTGWLSSHVTAKTSDSGETITTEVGVDTKAVPYARIHEYGGVTKPHVIVARRAQSLAFVAGGKTVFARKVNHPGSVMPERSYMRSGLADRAEIYHDKILEAVIEVTV